LTWVDEILWHNQYASLDPEMQLHQSLIPPPQNPSKKEKNRKKKRIGDEDDIHLID